MSRYYGTCSRWSGADGSNGYRQDLAQIKRRGVPESPKDTSFTHDHGLTWDQYRLDNTALDYTINLEKGVHAAAISPDCPSAAADLTDLPGEPLLER